MFVYDKAVRFEDVDAARIVFFARFLSYCHEAMEALLSPVEGGYASLVVDRHIGLPSVRVEADFASPLRFGDVVRIEVAVEHIGTTSCTFRYEMTNVKTEAHVARIRQVVVLSDLRELKKVAIPDDVRVLLETYRAAPESTSRL